MIPAADRVTLVDVTARDGLQDEPRIVRTARKAEIVAALAAAGITEIEATSFVHPAWVPQLADAEALVPLLPPGVRYSALIMNERGFDRALAAFGGAGFAPGSYDLAFVASASPRHNAANNNRTIAETLTFFDAIGAHPWVGAQLSQNPQPAVLRIWKAVGLQLQSLGLDGSALSDAGSALVSYVLGSAAQYAVGARRLPNDADRKAYLEALAVQLTEQDADPLVDEIADQLREHDDRDQFLAGVNIFLTGITQLSSGAVPPT